MPSNPKSGFTGNERAEFLQEEAKKLKVDDRIEIERCITPMSIDGGFGETEPQFVWDAATVIELLPPAPAGNPMFKIRYDDGREFVTPLMGVWRRFSH